MTKRDPKLLRIFQAMTAEPRNPQHHIDLANFHFSHGNYAEAVVSMRRAVKLEPENHIYHNNIGLCLNAAGKPAEAEPHFRAVLELEPSAPGAHENIGVCLMLQNRFSEAIEEFEESLRTDFFTPIAYSSLARIYKALKKDEKAKWYADHFMEEAISGKYASPEMLIEADNLMQEICGGEEPGNGLEFKL